MYDQFYTEVMYYNTKATLYQQPLNNAGTYWYIGPTGQFQFSPSWSGELGGTDQSSVYAGQFITIPVWQMRAAVAKKLWKDKGSLKAAISDIFYANQPEEVFRVWRIRRLAGSAM